MIIHLDFPIVKIIIRVKSINKRIQPLKISSRRKRLEVTLGSIKIKDKIYMGIMAISIH